MEYYIKGDAANAEQIRAALKAKGISDSGNSFIYNNYLYFTKDGETDFCAVNGRFASIIKTHPNYQELELSLESKFKMGNWIVRDYDGFTISIESVKDGYYFMHRGVKLSIKDVDKHYHLWTIADARDGDVLYSPCCKLLWIYKDDNSCYVGNNLNYNEDSVVVNSPICIPIDVVPATSKQRNLLFKKIQEAGYQWYAGKKELKKIIEPKFKVGDSLQSGCMWAMIRRIDTENQRYICQFDNVIPFEEQDRWNFGPNPKKHYDIANFQPKQWVLVRDCNDGEWNLTMFSYLHRGSSFLFICINGVSFKQCIPLEGNEKLLGTTDMPSEEYINWKT